MSNDRLNPYQSPTPSETKPPQLHSGALELAQSIRYVFDSPNWLINLLLLMVCNFIPVVGPIVIMGYQFEVVQALFVAPGQRYPDFDFNRIVEYLKRGVWPFLVGLAASVVLVPLILLFAFGFMVGGAALAQQGGDERTVGIVGIMVGLMAFAGIFALSLAVAVILVPFQLRAGLIQDFAAAFDLPFAKQFIGLVWKELTIGILFLLATAILSLAVGFALLCVGVYLTMNVVYLVQAHLLYQMYHLHVSRGGRPISLAAVTQR